MAIKLHRCPLMFLKFEAHPCWKVQSALDEAGIEYELVKTRGRPMRRDEVARLTGQRRLPVIEFEDGGAIREESGLLAARIRAGRLFEAAPD